MGSFYYDVVRREIVRLVLERVGIESRGGGEVEGYERWLKESEVSMRGLYRPVGEASMWCCLSTLEDSLASKVLVPFFGRGVECGSPGTKRPSERVLF